MGFELKGRYPLTQLAETRRLALHIVGPRKLTPFGPPPSMVSADTLYLPCSLQTAGWRGHPVLSSTAKGAYGAHLHELESGLVEKGLGRKGAGLRAFEVGTVLLWGYGPS